MNHPYKWLALVLLSLTIAGCASNNDDIDDGEMAEIDQASEASTGAKTAGAASGTDFEGEALEDPSSPLSDRIVYFEYDSSNLTSDAMNLLEVHGEYLSDNPNRQLLVEGHTDERGAREYNLALGERRAEAVKQALVLAGAGDQQINTVSYGEESPAVSGNSSAAWSQNRRAELIYER
ncbi:MAG: peptidoglycan-associated lipoprotein Pal [Spiribacter sp.]|jgi:peptidoglycan-associated lipoprotein|nr:peptidoglycan-associated lipoprotein Pal [Spiribacter sp.]MDR9489202.1 peptidoglycan-associated lipoprotein Pal [Spiribacter sp.]